MDKTTDMAKEEDEIKRENTCEEEVEAQINSTEEENSDGLAAGENEATKEEDIGNTEDKEINEENNQEDENWPDKYKEVNDKYLRLYAEFENFRKRSAREAIETYQNASAKLIEKLLPTLLDFERAFKADSEDKAQEEFKAGIKMIFNNFKDVLEGAGLEEINPEGEEFDPNLHEALMQQFHDTVEEDHIVQVFEKGFKVNSKIIKHAKVITSKGKEG